MAIKVYLANGSVVFEDSDQYQPKTVSNQEALTAEATSGTTNTLNVKIGGATGDPDTYLFYSVNYASFTDEDGTALGGTRAATITALQAILDDTTNLLSFVKPDVSAQSTGTTKLVHIKDDAGADRDNAGTLELDTHAASIGLYDSYLKITEVDLSNTGGKAAAFGRLQVYLENQGSAVEALDINMGQLSSAPIWDVSSYTTDWSAVNFNLNGKFNLKGTNSDVGEVRFYDTDDSHYIALKTGVINSNQTFVLPQADGTNGQALTTDGSGNLGFTTISGGSTQQTLEGQQIDFVTSATALNQTGYEGEVIKIGSGSSMSFGQLRYMSAAGSPLTARWVNANADAESTCSGFLAFALGSNAITDGMLTRGFVYHSNSYTPGDILYASKTAGGITNDISAYTTGDIVRIVGYAVNTGYIYFNPSPNFIELA